MPTGVIKGPESEAIWARAVKTTEEQYPGLKGKDKNKFYAIVMTIYKNMCTKHKCTPKNESDMSMILNRLELFGESLPVDYTGWQLEEPLNAEEKKLTSNVVRDLNKGMRTAMSVLNKWMMNNYVDVNSSDGMDKIGEELSVVWGKYIKPIINNKKYESTGITDAEPVYEAGQRLINFIKKYYGLTFWTSLGDYIH
ncbi:MAG: hypothetical protein P8Y23_00725 [Candidatus Lokiarchaeota archaeon]